MADSDGAEPVAQTLTEQERTIHHLLGCVACCQPEKYNPEMMHGCCDSCGLTYFADGTYYQDRKPDCARPGCEGEMFYG